MQLTGASCLRYPYQRHEKIAYTPKISSLGVNFEGRSSTTRRFAPFRSHDERRSGSPTALVLGINGVLGDIRDLYIAAAFDTGRAVWGVQGLPGSSWLLYRQRARDAWPALGAPWEAVILLRVLVDEGIIAGRSLKSGRSGPAVAHSKEVEDFHRNNTGLRPLVIQELIENWDMCLEVSLMRWGSLTDQADIQRNFHAHVDDWLDRMALHDQKYQSDMSQSLALDQDAMEEVLRSFEPEDFASALVPFVEPRQAVVAAIHAWARDRPVTNIGSKDTTWHRAETGKNNEIMVQCYCAGDPNVPWPTSWRILQRLGLSDGSIPPLSGGERVVEKSLDYLDDSDEAKRKKKNTSALDMCLTTSVCQVHVVDGCPSSINRWRTLRKGLLTQVGTEMIEDHCRNLCAPAPEGHSLGGPNPTQVRIHVHLSDWGWSTAAQRARLDCIGADTVSDLVLAEWMGVQDSKEVMDGVSW